MKNRAKWIIVPALVLSIGACKQKEVTQTPEASASESGGVKSPEAVAEPKAKEVPELSADERAAVLGFAKHLPKNTESLLTFHNGSKAATELKALKLWKYVESEVNGESAELDKPADAAAVADAAVADAAAPVDGVATEEAPKMDDAPAAPAAEEGFGPADLLGTEVTVALGKNTGDQLANVLNFSQRSNYFQFRLLAKGMVEAAKTGDPSAAEEIIGKSLNDGYVKDLINDPKSGLDSIEKAKLPPIYIAFRTVEAQREIAQQQLSGALGFLAMLGEAVSPIEAEKVGSKFAGYKISGAKVSELVGQNRASLEQSLDKATVDRLLEILAKKDIVVVSGQVADYSVLFIGSSLDELELAEKASDSIASSKALDFVDGYAKKDLSLVSFSEKGTLEAIVKASSGISQIVSGIHDGLKGAEGIGDISKLEASLKEIVEREEAVLKLASTEAFGLVGYIEDGYKLQSYGGTDRGVLAWKSPNTLAHLGKSPDAVLFANFSVDAEYDEKATAYFEAVFEGAYDLALKIAELPQTGELANYKQTISMFDTQFRPDLVNIWGAFSTELSKGLGKEAAYVIDFKGTVPPVPGIPQAFVNQGKFPRITAISPVVDRSQVSASWDKINASATSLLEKAGELSGQKFPMQKPISSEKNGNTTWFFSLPFFNDDFLPSVTVSDKWFAVSTSKNQALDLIDQASAGTPSTGGLTFHVNFKALQDYSKETLKLVDENAVAIFGQDTDKLAEFQANKAKISKAIETLDDFDSLDINARRESGQLRSTLHFKTR